MEVGAKRGLSWLRSLLLDPSTWIIMLGFGVRAHAAWLFDPAHGYDGHAHLSYVQVLRSGVVPRVETHSFWTAQNPPLYYALVVLLGWTGLFEQSAGQVVSVLAGTTRLFIADRLFRRWMGDRERFLANAIHAFLPFALRIDVFASNESLASTFSLAAVAYALRGFGLRAGLFLGAALLTKSSAVAAVPAVSLALLFCRPGPLRVQWSGAVKRLLTAGLVSFFLFLPWAWPNLARHHTPYPSAYDTTTAEWQRPIRERHAPAFFLPRLSSAELRWPYYAYPMSLPNALFFEAWGDYYNFLGKGPLHHRPPPEAANGRALGAAMMWTHIVSVHLGLLVSLFLLIGLARALARAVRRRMGLEELTLGALGFFYLSVAVLFAIIVPNEADGGVKATYALGSAPILCAWSANGLGLLSRWRVASWTATAVAIAPAGVAVVQRLVW